MGHAKGRLLAALATLVLSVAVGTPQAGSAVDADPASPDSRWFSQRTEESGYVRTIVEAIQPLDAPGNPYAGMYSDWDRWAIEHFQAGVSISEVNQHFEFPYDPQPDENGMVRQWMDMRVDAEGYLVPWAHYLASWSDPDMRFGSGGQEGGQLATAFAMGQVDNSLHASWKAANEQARVIGRAIKTAPIPAWIGEQPPLHVIGLPDGEFAVRGPFGLDLAGKDNRQIQGMEFRERWYRYSHDGRLLGTGDATESGAGYQSWMGLFFPGMHELIDSKRAEGLQPMYGQGILSFYVQPEPQRQLDDLQLQWDQGALLQRKQEYRACYDYLGNELEVAEHIDERGHVTTLPGVWSLMYRDIGPTYQAQLELGLTASDSTSPYAGSPDGPQLAGPEYRLPVYARIARRTGEDKPEAVELRPLDDPQNPWRGQYSRFDILNYEGSEPGNQVMSDMFIERYEANRRQIREAKEQGLTMEQFREQNPDFTTGISSTSMREAGIVNLHNYVSPEGFMVPLAISSAWPRTMEGDPPHFSYAPEVQELMLYRISNHVQLSGEDLAEYDEWRSTLADLSRLVAPRPGQE